MKTEREVEKFLEKQGITAQRVLRDGVETLRLLDTSQLPGSMKEQFDEQGFFIPPKETKTKGKGK